MDSWDRDNWAYIDGVARHNQYPPPIKRDPEPETPDTPVEGEEVLCSDVDDEADTQHVTMLQVAGWLTLGLVGLSAVGLVAAIALN